MGETWGKGLCVSTHKEIKCRKRIQERVDDLRVLCLAYIQKVWTWTLKQIIDHFESHSFSPDCQNAIIIKTYIV